MRLVKLLDYPIPHWWKDKTHALKVEVWEDEDDEGRWSEAGRVYLTRQCSRMPWETIRREVWVREDEWQEIRSHVQDAMRPHRTAASYLWRA